MAKAPTLITSSTVIRGRVSGQEDIDLDGRIEGQIEIDGTLKVDAKARADAQISAKNVYVHGVLIGDVTATDTIHITDTALVVGDLIAPRIIVDEGAQIRGLVDMGDGSSASPRSATRTTTKPAATRPPAPSARVVEDSEDDEDEPDLPAAASRKKVAVKKR